MGKRIVSFRPALMLYCRVLDGGHSRAFGDCLVNCLYGVYQDAHPGFVAEYVGMLEAGGAKHHCELLTPFGLDVSRREFWQKGLAVIEGMMSSRRWREWRDS